MKVRVLTQRLKVLVLVAVMLLTNMATGLVSVQTSYAAEMGTLKQSEVGARSVLPGIPTAWQSKEGYLDFYTKSATVYGIPILSSDDVPDEALLNAFDILDVYLRDIHNNYPAIIQNMIDNKCNIIIVGEHEVNVQHPDWSSWPDATERRGGGSYETTVLVEDLIVDSNDTWRIAFSGLVHEFSHTMLAFGIGDSNQDWAFQDIFNSINTSYENAMATGLYTESEYDRTNVHEYFCGQVGRWFNANPTALNVEDAENKTDREQLESYDPDIYTVCEELFGPYQLIAPWGDGSDNVIDTTIPDVPTNNVTPIIGGYRMENDTFIVDIGEFGEIKSLKIVGDKYPTDYVMNSENSGEQDTAGHEWLGELMFKTKVGAETEWKEALTQSSSSARSVTLEGDKVVVTYANATEEKGIKDFKLIETYSLVDSQLHWEIYIENTNTEKLTVGDLGLPLPFNEKWPGGEQIYETRTVDHSFVGKNSSYIYVTRPSGEGQFLLMTPDASTDAGFEYQDHWRVEERPDIERAWCSDQGGWANGLNVFYIHSDVIKSTNRGYLENTSLELEPGASKTYAFNFSVAANENDMKTTLYNEGIIDAVAIPGMAFAKNMPAKLYLHTNLSQEDITFTIQCPHEAMLFAGKPKTISNLLPENKDENTYVTYSETKMVNGEQYLIYDIAFSDLGQNNVFVNYLGGKQTVLQFYMLDDVSAALETHGDFMVNSTQWNTPGTISDKVFDDWMMDTKAKRGVFDGYWGWGDDWGLTHGEYLAEKNVYQPVSTQIQALDEYLDVAIWNGLMREHQEDYMIHDFLMEEPNDTPIYRGYAYPHIYNTYFSMYKIASKYPSSITYKETADTYLLRAYNIMNALYQPGVAYNWDTGLMGELTTPSIIEALDKEGYYTETDTIRAIMSEKYDNFKGSKYPYGSEYSYDNTGEEAVYTLAKMNGTIDTANANTMMSKIDAKTRACRGIQPVWYQYADPVTICGENWWNFQYTASLAGYAMDDWLRIQDNGKTVQELALAERLNYAAKLANLTCINSGQIDADPENIGAVAWTYQSEMGNLGGFGTGGGNMHNGWRQMSGEADLGLFGALQILSSDVAVDPVFGLFGYGCQVSEVGNAYEVIPLDGLFTRLNLINEQLYVELDRDQYTNATISKDKTKVELTIKNLEKTEHESDIELTGLLPGTYQILVNNVVKGSFLAIDGKTAIVTAPLTAAETSIVTVQSGAALDNSAPVVNASSDATIRLSDGYRLDGTVKDDGYPNMTLTSAWIVESLPDNSHVVMKNADKIITEVSFDTVGTYVLKLDVSDGELTGTDSIVVTVLEDLPIPAVLAQYTFDTVDDVNKLVKDGSGSGYDAFLVGNPTLAAAKVDNGVVMDGKIGGYVKLPAVLTRNVDQGTISLDVNLDGIQGNGTRAFEFGDMNEHYLYVSFENGNEVKMTVTNVGTGENQTVSTGVTFASGYWKNIAVTLGQEDAILYIDGIEKAKITNCGFKLSDLGAVQRNYLGRSNNEKIPFLKGMLDNFEMRSTEMSAADMFAAYGTGVEREILSGVSFTGVTTVGVAPSLPETIKVLFSDGTYEQAAIAWESVPEASYAEKGTIDVTGTINETDVTVAAKIMVIKGTIQNVAAEATPTAIVNTPHDLGGVVGLNDGFDPTNSGDTSHGVWHNWLGGDQGGEAWVQYNWDSDQILTGIDAYYFEAGNFAPATVKLQYLESNGAWVDVENPKGLGVAINQYNATSFDPVVTKALKMIMTPLTLGVGVIEWKVYGYSEAIYLNKKDLRVAIIKATDLKQDLFTDGWDGLQDELLKASATIEKVDVTQEEIDSALGSLNKAIASLVPEGGNIAYTATVSTSYVSPWEKLSAVNDGAFTLSSNPDSLPRYGTWGNASGYETVTYLWSEKMSITSTSILIFNDGGGILSPESYKYEYKDQDGNWQQLTNPVGLGLDLDRFNETTFDAFITQEFRITMNKQVEDGNGIGLIEWIVNGQVVGLVEAVKAPTASMPSGTYTSEQKVALASETEEANIYYTTDGSEPNTESALYSEPIDIDSSKTLKTVAVKSGMANSEVVVFEYIIEIPLITTVDIVADEMKVVRKNNTIVSFTVSLMNITDMNAFDFKFSYNDDVLIFKNAEVVSDIAAEIVHDKENNTIRVIGGMFNPLTADNHQVIKLNFRLVSSKDNPAVATGKVGIIDCKVADAVAQTIIIPKVDHEFASVEILTDLYDVNLDGTLNILDVSFALRAYLGTSTDSNWDEIKYADVNNDLTIDLIDLLMIVKVVSKR